MSMPPPPPFMSPPPGYVPYQAAFAPQYAGFGSRLGAYLIDTLVMVLFGVPALIVFLVGPRETQACTVNGLPGHCRVPTGSTLAILIPLALAGVIAFIVIYCGKVGRGQSWGHSAVGIRVADASTGEPIGTARAVGRFFGRYLSSFLCYLGFFWMLWDSRKQTWHDKMTNAVVVRV